MLEGRQFRERREGADDRLRVRGIPAGQRGQPKRDQRPESREWSKIGHARQMKDAQVAQVLELGDELKGLVRIGGDLESFERAEAGDRRKRPVLAVPDSKRSDRALVLYSRELASFIPQQHEMHARRS